MGFGEYDDDIPPDLSKALGQLHAVHAWHINIQQGEVNHMACRIGDGLVWICEFSYDLEIWHIRAFELKQL